MFACLFVHLGLTHEIFHILCGFRARCILTEFWSHVFLLGLWTKTNCSVFHGAIRHKTPTHGNFGIVGICGLLLLFFHCWWSFDSEWSASLLYRFSWIFCKVFGIPVRLKFCILEAGPDSNACARSPDSDRKPDCPIVKAGTSCPIVRFMCLPDNQIQGWRQNPNLRQIRNKSPIVRISCVAQIVRPTRIKQRARLSESRFRVRFVWCH